MPSTRRPSTKGLSRLERDVLATIEEHHMLQPGERVAVACSGGADSTALLNVLCSLAQRFGWVVSVAHFNHQLRGGESDADARFVRELAGERSLGHYESSADVRAEARRTHANIEAAARALRYAFLRSLVSTGKVDRIAVGHTADDQAETVLLRLLRGTGPQGLAAIRPTLAGGIIRPLLAVRRCALRAWLQERRLNWREDSSNQDLRLRRNLVRSKLLPALEEINPSVAEALAQTAALAQADDSFWKRYVYHLERKYTRRGEQSIEVELDALHRLPHAAALRLLRSALLAVSEPQDEQASLSYNHIRSLLEWATALKGENKAAPPRLALPGNLAARRNSKHLILFGRSAQIDSNAGRQSPGYQLTVTPPCDLQIPGTGLRCQLEFIDLAGRATAYNKGWKALLDRSAIELPVVLRSWRAGDAYQPAGRHKSQKLKELFQRHRIPVGQRASWPVLESAGRIVWSWQFGPALGVAASESTRQALRVTVRPDAASNELSSLGNLQVRGLD